jgi:hypothetical protein
MNETIVSPTTLDVLLICVLAISIFVNYLLVQFLIGVAKGKYYITYTIETKTEKPQDKIHVGMVNLFNRGMK